MPSSIRWLLIGAALLIFAKSSPAHFRDPELEPVDRLVRNTMAYLEKHPSDADAHYTLARIYYLSFSTKSNAILAYNAGDGSNDQPASVISEIGRRWYKILPPQIHEGPSPSLLLDYASKSKQEFEASIKLQPGEARYYLGLASLLEEVRDWIVTAPPSTAAVEFQELTFHDLRKIYLKAFIVGLPRDSKEETKPMMGLEELVSYEAAKALVRLGPATGFQGDEESDLKKAKAAMRSFENLPPCTAITPIVFSFLPTKHLSERLAPEAIVDFDLRGYGWRERWTWVKPSLGFLVWDPLHTGKITSARQLFGSYTFQIFRKTGYDALAALDDNGDGFLSDSELRGISVWFDRNSDGVSQPAEVTPVEDLPIRSIATSAHERDDIHPTNPRGLVLSDGQALPTWDWIVAPVPAESPLALAGTTSVK